MNHSATARPWKQFPNVVTVLIVVLLALNYFYPFGDLDFGILVRLGQLIVHTGQLRPPESFTYTIHGKDVPDYEWLYEVILYGIWKAFGFGGLKLFKVLTVFAPLVVLGWHLHDQKVRWHGIVLVELIAVAALVPVWNLRPLYLTTLCLLLLTTRLHDHCTGRRPLPWWMPLMMLLWGNLHPGVILGQGLLPGVIAWEWINRPLKINFPSESSACWRLTWLGGLGFLATFLSPDPLGRFLAPFDPQVRHPVMQIFSEMRPLYTFTGQAPYTAGLVYVVAAVVAVTAVLRFRRYRLWEIGLLLGLAFLANKAFRSLQDWLLVMLALGTPHAAAVLGQWAKTSRRRLGVKILLRLDRSWKRMCNSPLLRLQWFWPAAALAGLALLSLIPPLSRHMPVQNAREWPAAAVDWLEQRPLPGDRPLCFFAPPDYGAYLIWRLYDPASPQIQVYADTRGFVFPHDILEKAHHIPQLVPEGAWRRDLEEVLNGKTQYFLLEAAGPRGKLWEALKPYVSDPLYLDDQAVLLTRCQVQEGLAGLTGAGSPPRRAS